MQIQITPGHITRPVTLMLGRYVPVEKIDPIDQIVCNEFDITLEELHGKDRSNRIAFPRMLAMTLHRELGWTFDQIGKHYGDKDHGTVIHAKHRCQDLMETWPWFAEKAKAVRARL